MIKNPEYIRNVWLEFSAQRLIITPAVLAIVFFLVGRVGGESAIASVAFYLFLFFAYVWGTRAASDSLCEEINTKTWDWQRMSSLSPLSMMLGKLLGSTSFAWYGALLSLFVYMWFGTMFHGEIAILLLGALFAHTLAMLFSFEAVNFRLRQKMASFRFFVVGLLMAYVMTSQVYLLVKASNLFTIQWHGQSFTAYSFFLVSFLIFFAWAFIGLWRLVRLELQYRNIPWVWGVFTLYTMIYLSGFVTPVNLQSMNVTEFQMDVDAFPFAQYFLENLRWFIAFYAAIVLTYVSVLFENVSALHYQRALTAFKASQWINALTRMPRWPVSFVLALMAGMILALMPAKTDANNALFVLSFLLFATRDILIVHYFSFGPKSYRAILASLFYFAVLYVLLPSLFSILHLPFMTYLFVPSIGEHVVASVLGPLIQVGIIGALVATRWKGIKSKA